MSRLAIVVCAVVGCYAPAAPQDAAPSADAVAPDGVPDAALDAAPDAAPDAMPDAPMLTEQTCNDGVSDDGDNAIDCADIDCRAATFCTCSPVGVPVAPAPPGALDSFGVLDLPAGDNSVLLGPTLFRGWALDAEGVAQVRMVIDGQRSVTLPYGMLRSDVCMAYPGYPGCNNVGFSATLDVGTLSKCQHIFEIIVRDSLDIERVIVRKRFAVE